MRNYSEEDARRRAIDIELGRCRRCHRRPVRPGKATCTTCAPGTSTRSVAIHRETKQKAVEYLGGQCYDCGLRTCIYDVYDFHHVDPNTKVDSIRNLRNRKWATIQAELDKCVLLCATCHRIREFYIHGQECE